MRFVWPDSARSELRAIDRETASLAVIGSGNRVLERVLGVFSWQDLLHLELRSGAASYDRLRPFLNRLALLTPVLSLPRRAISRAEFLKAGQP
jgi:hypothetical protein